MKICVRWAVRAGLLCAVLASVYFLRGVLLPPMARYLETGSEPQRVDAVMALPGDPERRPFVAAAMVKAGLADRVLVPSTLAGLSVESGLMPRSDDLARWIYAQRGIRREQIVSIGGKSDSTWADMEGLRRYLLEHVSARVAVVTSAFHTRRTRWTLDMAIPDAADRVIIVSAPNIKFRTDTWWRSRYGFRYVLSEYLKLGYYWIRYGRGAYWCAAAVGAVVIVMIGRTVTARRHIARQAVQRGGSRSVRRV